MNLTQSAFWLGTSALVAWSAQAQPVQPVAPAVNPAASAAAPPPPTPGAAGPAPAPAAGAPVAPPATEPAAAPLPAAPPAAPAAPPIAAAPAPIQLAAAPDESENRARAERAKANSRAAVRSSPFMDATLNGTWLEDRYGDPFVFGVQGGAYLGEIVRVAVRLEMPTENARDEYSNYDSSGSSAGPGGTFSFSNPQRSKAPTLLYGAALGAVATSSENFVFAPGLVFMRSDVSDYGSMLGISMPFEWVTSHGMRFGLELDLGRAFGGTVHNETCTTDSMVNTVCTASNADRPPGRAFALRFQMGFGFNRAR